jgi:hypothetical protein
MKRRIPGAFVPHTLALLDSPAWRALSREAQLLLARVEIEHMRHGGKENGRLIIPYADFENYIGGHCRVIARALRDTEALGLLHIARGRAGHGVHRSPNEYRLTYIATADAPPSNEWAEISSIEDAKARLAGVKRRRNPSPWLKAKAANIVPFRT